MYNMSSMSWYSHTTFVVFIRVSKNYNFNQISRLCNCWDNMLMSSQELDALINAFVDSITNTNNFLLSCRFKINMLFSSICFFDNLRLESIQNLLRFVDLYFKINSWQILNCISEPVNIELCLLNLLQLHTNQKHTIKINHLINHFPIIIVLKNS